MEKMIADPEDYFRGFVPVRDELLQQIEKTALAQEIPIVGPVVGALLGLLARTSGARRILELGTASGYSTIYLARGCAHAKGQVVTIEGDPDLAAQARENFAAVGIAEQITIRVGMAQEILTQMSPGFDMVFLDIEKEQYAPVLPDCHRLLRSGGLLVADNTGFNDARPFNRTIFEDPRWEAVQFLGFWPEHSPEKDGVCLAVKR